MSDHYCADAVVIGAGVIGAAVALELARGGRKTISVDRLPAAGYGSTSSSCAIIRVHYSTLEGTAFAYDGYFDWKYWKAFLDSPVDIETARFQESGCLVMKTEGNGHLEKIVANVEKLSIPYEHWDARQIVKRLPGYDLQSFAPARRIGDPGFGEPGKGRIEGGVFFPTAGFVSDPQLAAQNIQAAAAARGAQFLFNREVTAIPVSANRVGGVTLDDGTTISAPVVVNVAGPHSSKVNRMIGADVDMKITTRALRQEVAHVPAPQGFDFESSKLVISDNDIGVYCRPETGNFVLAGSEDPECDLREWVDPDDFSRDFTEQATTQALRLAQRMSGLKVPTRMRGVVDLYDVTEDWLPIYDRSAVDGFYMACGSSGNQFKNAPAAGRLMAGLIDYCEAGNDHDRHPLQFGLAHIDFVLDTATMSRLRKVNPDSSFSVLG
ncbi:MAG: FAD-dependent oxidoreductase [Arenicellales bacterium]|nr:FAD-dependent oxidoreductase [Arenicellales bacterium]